MREATAAVPNRRRTRGVATSTQPLPGPIPPGGPVVTVPIGLVVGVRAGGVPPGSFGVAPAPSSPCGPASPTGGPRLVLDHSSPPARSAVGPLHSTASLTGMDIEDVDPGELPSDEELTALALAADPAAPIADDAVPIGCTWPVRPGTAALVHATDDAPGRAPLEGARRDRHRRGLPADRRWGLCNTYGILASPEDASTSTRGQHGRGASPAPSASGSGLARRHPALHPGVADPAAVAMFAQALKRAFSSSLSWEYRVLSGGARSPGAPRDVPRPHWAALCDEGLERLAELHALVELRSIS